MRLPLAVGCLLAFASAPLRAQDKVVTPAEQKAAAQALLKAAGYTATLTESDHFLLYSPYAKEKSDAISAGMEKAYLSAAKALGYKPAEIPVMGKVAVFLFPDAKAHKSFALQALKRPVRGREAYDLDLRGDAPTILDNTANGAKLTDAQLVANASQLAAAGLLNVKAGVTKASGLPTWLELGFGEAAALHAEGNAAKLAAYKAKAKALAARTQGKAFAFGNVWGDGATAGADATTVATSLADYLAYGPQAEKFPAILSGLKPAEGNDSPTMETALAAADWKPAEAELAWRRWVLTGK